MVVTGTVTAVAFAVSAALHWPSFIAGLSLVGAGLTGGFAIFYAGSLVRASQRSPECRRDRHRTSRRYYRRRQRRPGVLWHLSHTTFGTVLAAKTGPGQRAALGSCDFRWQCVPEEHLQNPGRS